VTGKQQALEILGDGKPHSHRELYSRLRGNPNVISKLRKDGHNIVTVRHQGEWWYQLGERYTGRPAPAPLVDGTVPEVAPDQMSLEDVL